jgi:hypothetical protein
MNFEAAILEGDRAKVFRPIGPDFFREEDNVRLIYRPKISGEGVEVLEGGEEVMLDQVPVPLEESGAKAVRYVQGWSYRSWRKGLAWDSKSSSMRFGYSYFTGHEVFNL